VKNFNDEILLIIFIRKPGYVSFTFGENIIGKKVVLKQLLK